MRRISKYSVVVGLVSLFVFAVGAWLYLHHYIPGKITFHPYEPHTSSIKVTDRTIEALYIPSAKPARYTQLHLTLSDGSTIFERKQAGQFAYECDNTANQQCTVKTSPKGQQYIERQGPSGHSLDWAKDGTKIRVNLDETNGKGVDAKSVQSFVDSFEVVKPPALPVQYIDKSSI